MFRIITTNRLKRLEFLVKEYEEKRAAERFNETLKAAELRLINSPKRGRPKTNRDPMWFAIKKPGHPKGSKNKQKRRK